MILVPFFAISTVYGSTKNLLSLPFQAPVFFGLSNFGSTLTSKNKARKDDYAVQPSNVRFFSHKSLTTQVEEEGNIRFS